jgi:hypothetical protein
MSKLVPAPEEQPTNVGAPPSADEVETPDAPPAAAPAAPASPAKSFFARRIWTRTGKVITIIVSVVSFATGVIGVIPILTRDATGLGSLEVSATPYEAGPREFAVAPGVDLATFPSDTACGPQQLAWLETNAQPLAHRLTLDLGNRASEGSMLALTDFRAVVSAAPGDALVRVVCESVMPDVQSARLFVDQPAATAFFGGDAFGDGNRPDSPVAWNLAPGENGTIIVDLLATSGSTGALEVTATSGRDAKTIEITGSEFQLPGLVAAGTRYLLATGDGFACRADDGVECTVESLFGG